ncbi:hypothetical protein KEM54_002813 [Ascosphaera aggregata]|nr:hypothetical protein KEM54_002813 [Ascosphaera aggregata]
MTNLEMTAVKNDVWCEVRVIAQPDSHNYMEALISKLEAVKKDTHASVILNEAA